MATRRLIGMVMAGAGIVALVAVLLRSGGEATGPGGRAGPGSAAARGLGVRGSRAARDGVYVGMINLR